MITISDGTETFELTDEEVKYLESDMISMFDWLVNAAQNKLRQVTNVLIREHTGFNPKKMTLLDKKVELRDKPIKSGKQKEVEMIAMIAEEGRDA